MLKTILVSVNGFQSDDAALDTAYLAARPFNAHIECLHILADPVRLATRASVCDLGTGMSGGDFFAALAEEDQTRSKQARNTFLEFCKRRRIPLSETPVRSEGISTAWREITGDEVEATIARARFHDLIVMARPPDGAALSIGGVGAIMVECGRPLLLAASQAPPVMGSTIAIAWKDSAEAARAMTAAMPLLSLASKILVLSGDDNSVPASALAGSAECVAAQLRWHGLTAEARCVAVGARTLPDAIVETASSLGADLMVMGGYSHSRIRELVFGGFTRHVLAASPLPVLLFR